MKTSIPYTAIFNKGIDEISTEDIKTTHFYFDNKYWEEYIRDRSLTELNERRLYKPMKLMLTALVNGLNNMLMFKQHANDNPYCYHDEYIRMHMHSMFQHCRLTWFLLEKLQQKY